MTTATITLDDVVAGPTGPAGPRGYQGVQGRTGADGPTGPAGVKGFRGEAGVCGPTGPRGAAGAGGAVYEHVQADPSATWTVNHNFGRTPCFCLTTTGGVAFDAEVIHTSSNQLVVLLAVPTAGTCSCI